MTKITTLFWDIGGVILTNGWDRIARKAAADTFHLESEEFEERHGRTVSAFEMGQISLDEYLQSTVFYKARSFEPEDFKAFIFEQSRELSESRAVLDAVTRAGKYFVAALNNEARELNEYRIGQFDLRRNFAAFFTSCYVGLRKPDQSIYRMALEITQRNAGECVFIDDRAENVEPAKRAGMQTIHFQNAAQLRHHLAQLGVALAASA